MSVPLYLAEPMTADGHVYGEVQFNTTSGDYVIKAEPVVLEFCKRIFPGSKGRHHEGYVRFKASKRTVGDLNWLLLRFPMEIKCPEQFGLDRGRAIEHAARRADSLVLVPSTPPPTFKGELMPYQAEGVSFMIQNERTLLADDMGLGKTVSALAAIATAGAFPALVVAPTTVQRQWCDMAAAFLELPSDDLLQTQASILRGRTPKAFGDTPIIVIHYGLIADWKDALLDHGFKSVIFDEIQELRHTGTAKYSAASELSGAVPFCWGLSGTPIYNYGSEIWSVLNSVEYHCLSDWEAFSREWCTG